MPRRALFQDEDEENSGSIDHFQERNAPKRRRTTGFNGDSSQISQDSGFMSGNLATPVDGTPLQEQQYSAELLETINGFKDVPPMAGIIKKIHLKNFMCHGNLEVKLGKNVNFITGRNGSGKSAIMAALVLGLGGKPSTLNRGNSAKEYIQTGCNSAEISITFGNTGPEAYKPELFGNELTVERSLSASGPSKYKIKSSKGGIISTRFAEIDAILRSYNFQLDNPMMILTQDTSRTFLNQCNPKKLFELFYRGTQLQKIDADFGIVKENYAKLAEIAGHRKEIIRELKEDVEKLDVQIKMHDEAQGNRERLRYLAHELVWAKVRDAQSELDKVEKVLERATESRNAAEAQFEDANTKELEAEAKLAEKDAELRQLQSELDGKRRECMEAQQLVDVADQKATEKKNACDKFTREISRLQRDTEGLRQHIRESQEQQMDADKKRRRDEKEAQLQQLQANRPTLEAQIQNHTNEMAHWENSSRNRSDQRTNLQCELQRVTYRLNGAKNRFEEFQMARSDTLARFGREAPRLAQLIESAVAQNRFHRRPRGPIGAAITIKDDRWGLAIESALGGNLLRGYMVHDFHDNQVLEELMRRAGYDNSRKPNIFIRAFGDERSAFDVSQTETRSDNYPNILSLLKIDDVIIRNLVIDQRRVEVTVLFQTQQEMIAVMRQQPPTRATSAYDIEGGNAALFPNFRFYPGGSYGGNRVLVKSVEEQLNHLDREIKQLSQEEARIKGQMAEIQKQIASDNEQKKRCSDAIQQIERQKLQDDSRMRKLRGEIKELTPENMDIAMLETEIDDNNRKMAEQNEKLENAKAEWQTAKSKLEEAQAVVREKKTEERTANAAFVERQKEVDQLTGQKNRCRNNTEMKRRALGIVQNDLEKATGAVAAKRQEKDKLLEEAREICEEAIVTDRDCKVITGEMRRIERNLEIFEQQATSLEELTEERQSKAERLKKHTEYLTQLKKTYQLLEKAIRIRERAYRLIKTMAKIEVKQKFVTHLAGRNYSGKISIDYENALLSIFVEPRQSGAEQQQSLSQSFSQQSRRKSNLKRPRGSRMFDKDSNRTQDLRGLSGGERSYSTVSFILALWETMNTPSCCLDEFDVFMDHYARRVIMEFLILFALKTRPMSQFIFLTPLSVRELPFNVKGLNVLELHEPRDRGGVTRDGGTTQE